MNGCQDSERSANALRCTVFRDMLWFSEVGHEPWHYLSDQALGMLGSGGLGSTVSTARE